MGGISDATLKDAHILTLGKREPCGSWEDGSVVEVLTMKLAGRSQICSTHVRLVWHVLVMPVLGGRGRGILGACCSSQFGEL